jgi:DhnA family fructose-bisphosphate aldolase class Ia
MLQKAREAMEAGATGIIFGRHVWQREHDESLRFVARLRDIRRSSQVTVDRRKSCNRNALLGPVRS